MAVIVLYFGYGSNCDIDSLRRYLVQHGVDPAGITNPRRALLQGWQIRTNYLMASFWGAANIEPAKGRRVEGVVMDVSAGVYAALIRKEGAPRRYVETPVVVQIPPSRRLVMASTFIVTPEYRLRTDMRVHPAYREAILQGARSAGFTQRYQRHLSRILRTA